MHKVKDVLTTGQVARLCNVAPRTVSKWFDGGQLRGYRIPGSRDRRIPKAQLVSFMKAHGMPLNGLDAGSMRVLVLDADTAVGELLDHDAFVVEKGLVVSTVNTAFEAGAAAESLKPAVLAVDVSLPDVCAAQLRRDLRAHADLESIKLIAMSASMSEAEGQRMLQAGFDAYIEKPFDARQFVDAIGRVIDAAS